MILKIKKGDLIFFRHKHDKAKKIMANYVHCILDKIIIVTDNKRMVPYLISEITIYDKVELIKKESLFNRIVNLAKIYLQEGAK